jgi:carbon monoxide dehydrogenase subunit G
VRVARSIELPCDPSAAWAVLTDWEAQAAWMRDADRVTVVSAARTGVGVRLAVRTRLFQIPAFTETMEVVGWDPPRSLTIAHGGPVDGLGTWLLESLPGERTRFTWIEEVTLGLPLVGGFAAWCYRPVLRALMGRSQRDLSRRLAST